MRDGLVRRVQGAGDTTVAALALARLAGASLLEACIVANAAASVAVTKIGTAAVAASEMGARLARVRSAVVDRSTGAGSLEPLDERSS